MHFSKRRLLEEKKNMIIIYLFLTKVLYLYKKSWSPTRTSNGKTGKLGDVNVSGFFVEKYKIDLFDAGFRARGEIPVNSS